MKTADTLMFLIHLDLNSKPLMPSGTSFHGLFGHTLNKICLSQAQFFLLTVLHSNLSSVSLCFLPRIFLLHLHF
jgi:hypothetical protein